MRLQIIEKEARFSCGSCGACCNQPWRTAIEVDKAQALDRHDFSKYPQLAGRRLYHPPADGRRGFFDLAKGEGTKCLFLGTDGLCIIHKEMGAAAKPSMCRQFPLLSSRTWVDERVSLNYGCPSVQAERGATLAEQAEDIAAILPLSGRPAEPDTLIPLDSRISVTLAENDAIFDRMQDIFGDHRNEDVWTRFSEALLLLRHAIETKKREPISPVSLSNDEAPDAAFVAPSNDNPCSAPLPVRMLFAATLQPDTVPAGLTGRMGFLGKLTLIPRLLTLANLSGVYASRLLGRNVSINAVLRHELSPELEEASSRLLVRYVRSRLWARTLAGTRLSIVAGVHQHIHDLNAVLFLARAIAQAENASRLAHVHIQQGLTLVEMHMANQPRVYDQVLRGWLRAQLNNLDTAVASLRLMRCASLKKEKVG